MPKDDGDIVEVKCPDCNETIRIPRAQAEAEFKAKCSKGHEVLLAKAL